MDEVEGARPDDVLEAVAHELARGLVHPPDPGLVVEHHHQLGHPIEQPDAGLVVERLRCLARIHDTRT